MKAYYSIILSLLIVLSMLPTALAVGTTEKVAVVVSTPADAIVAAPYAKAMEYDLIYTPSYELSREAERELITGGYTKVIIVGGPVAVSKTVENRIRDLKIKTERIWGETRVETSTELYNRLKKEKPELIGNVVIVQGFNEKISPVAVSFNTPVLYYGLNRENKVLEVLKDTEIKNAVILGEKIPKAIMATIPRISENSFIASGPAEDVLSTAISYIKKINPGVKNKDIVVVYTEDGKKSVIKGILNFLKGEAGILIPLPSKDVKVLKNIFSKVIEISYNILVVSDDPEILKMVLNSVRKLGPVSVLSISPREGRRGTEEESISAPSSVSTSTDSVVTLIASGKKIEFIGQNKDTLRISGDFNLPVLKVEAEVNVVDKDDKKHNLTIDFRDNKSVESVIEAMNNFNVVSYLGDKVDITYFNPELVGKKVSFHVITERRALRDDINRLLKGDAKGLIELLNRSYIGTKTVGSNGKVTFTYKPSINGEHIVVITQESGVPKNADDVKILALGGFEVVKYRLSMRYHLDPITDTVHINMVLEGKPENPVRYGAVIVRRNSKVTLKITGTDPDNNYFNVSVVGDKGKYQVVSNSDFIKLNASTVEKIVREVYKDETASLSYSDITLDNSYYVSLPHIEKSYIIGVVYDTKDKKIVAVAQESLE